MADPSYCKSATVTTQFRETEYHFRLYMHQTIGGPGHNQIEIANPRQPEMFGYTNVHDYPIYDGIGPNARIVARAQGLHSKTSMTNDSWFHWSSILFSEDRFRGSSFKAMGEQSALKGEWAVVGGTGLFMLGQGSVTLERVQQGGQSNIKRIDIRAICRTKAKAAGASQQKSLVFNQQLEFHDDKNTEESIWTLDKNDSKAEDDEDDGTGIREPTEDIWSL